MPNYTHCCPFIWFLLALIASVASPQNHVLSLDGDGDCVEVINNEGLSDADEQVRQNAAWILAEFGASATAAPALMKSLDDPNEKVRRYAVWALAELNELPHETAPALIEEALTDESYEVRRDMTEALSRMDTPPPAAVPGLTRALADESYEVRRNAAGALAQIGSAATAAVPALIQTLHDENEEVRQKAAWALRRIGIPETMANVYTLQEKANGQLMLGIFIAIGTMHLLLFLFYPRSVNNLYYTIWIGNIVLLIVLHVLFSPVPEGARLHRAMWIVGLGMGLSGLRFLYALFYTRLPKQFWAFLALWIPLVIGLYLTPSFFNDDSSSQALLVALLLLLFLLGTCVEGFRVLLMAIIRKKDGAWIISIGFMALIAVFIVKVVNGTTVGNTPLRFLDEAMLRRVWTPAVFGLLVSASTYLARNFARTSKALEAKNAQLIATQHQLVMKEKMASLGNLVAGVAHEMNNPIGAIHSAADVATRGIRKINSLLQNDQTLEQANDSDRRLQRSLKLLERNNQAITTASDRIAHIVQSLRSFARLDEAQFQKADVYESIDTTLTLLQHELKDKAEVIKEYSAIPHIYCYPSELNQVWMNLLRNAVQAIDESGTIKIATSADETQVHVRISDTGKGIPPQNLQKIFDPGFTTQGGGVGTGLGLSIVHNIIQKHHGDIKVSSIVGEGTEFLVSLPLEQTS